MSIFAQQSSLFSNPVQPNQQNNQGSSIFGSANATQNQSKPNPFNPLNINTNTSQPQQGGGLFGSSQPAQTGNVFGQPQQQTTQQGSGLFGGLGATNQQSQQQQQPQQQGGSSIFGGLGQSTQQSQQQQQPQQQGGSSIFGGLAQSTQQPQQTQPQGSVLGQSQGQSRLFQGTEIAPRQKSVIDQIELAFAKWNPQSPHTLFQSYLYNAVPLEDAPFYGPGPGEDETKWEEALAKKPSPGSIPVAVRGFEQLALRMQQQYQNLTVLRGRLKEINDGLNALLQKHDLETSIRVVECRRKHLMLSKQCLNLAAKTQVLRNRGYAMDAAEEELSKKLLTLEKRVTDPALTGRSEEIWARMVSVRERMRVLQREYEKAGRNLEGQDVAIDEEVMKRAGKILEDYSSQILHLRKELEEIQKDWDEFEAPQRHLKLANGR